MNGGKFILLIASVFRHVEQARTYTCEVIYISIRCINIVRVAYYLF